MNQKYGSGSSLPQGSSSTADRKGLWRAERSHSIQDVAGDDRFGFLRPRMTSPKPAANDRLTRYGLIGHISLKKVFSTRACSWYPDSFFHWRRPTFLTRLTVRSRALDHLDLVAVFLRGTMTFAPRAAAAS